MISSKKIAVVGAGIAGLGAAWTLQQAGAKVSLLEAADCFGGHAHTVDVAIDGKTFGVDTGFLVFNHRTYPQLLKLFAQLEVETAPSDMGFSVQLHQPSRGPLEWAGNSLSSIFAQRRNLFRPTMWQMLVDIVRFNRLATRLATQTGRSAPTDQSVAQFLEAHRFSHAFQAQYLLPMIACIWSCSAKQMMAYPIQTLTRFCYNHGLLQINDRPQWYTVADGSRNYVQKIMATLRQSGSDVRSQAKVLNVQREPGTVTLHIQHHHQLSEEVFDAVIFATHSDQTLKILGAQAKPAERDLLGRIGYQNNVAVLHTDTGLLPAQRRAWAAWNYERHTGSSEAEQVCLHYWLNALQPLPTQRPIIVSLNPLREPASDKVLYRIDYAHPIFDAPAIEAQSQLPSLHKHVSVMTKTWFAGAWTGYGFHEDGLRSGIEAANKALAHL